MAGVKDKRPWVFILSSLEGRAALREADVIFEVYVHCSTNERV